MKHKDTEKEPIHSLIIIFIKGRSLDQAVTSATTPNLNHRQKRWQPQRQG